jgi:hypothetical protein
MSFLRRLLRLGTLTVGTEPMIRLAERGLKVFPSHEFELTWRR